MVSPQEPGFTLSDHARHVMKERGIRHDWVAQTLAYPSLLQPDQEDANLQHALRRIEQFGGRVLRVVYNSVKQPPHVVTTYFDRSMRDKL